MNNIVEKSHIIIIEAWNALTEFEYSSRRSAWEVIFRTSKGLTLIGDSIWMTTWKWSHHTHYLIEISLETSACFQVWHIKESRNENTESLPLDPKSKRGETGAPFVCISFLYTGRIWGTTAHFLQDHWQTCINCAAEVQNQPPFLSQKFSRSDRFSDTRTHDGTIHSLHFLRKPPRTTNCSSSTDPRCPENENKHNLVTTFHHQMTLFQ